MNKVGKNTVVSQYNLRSSSVNGTLGTHTVKKGTKRKIESHLEGSIPKNLKTKSNLNNKRITKKLTPFLKLVNRLKKNHKANHFVSIISKLKKSDKDILLDFFECIQKEKIGSKELDDQMHTILNLMGTFNSYPGLGVFWKNNELIKKVLLHYSSINPISLTTVFHIQSTLGPGEALSFYNYLNRCLSHYQDGLQEQEDEEEDENFEMIISNLRNLLYYENIGPILENLAKVPVLLEKEAIIVYCCQKWPVLWEAFQQSERINDLMERVKAAAIEQGDSLDDIPSTWDELENDCRLFELVGNCKLENPLAFGSIREWFYEFHDNQGEINRNEDQFVDYIRRSKYKESFKVILNFFYGEYTTLLSPSTIAKFLNFTRNNYELLAGIVSFIPSSSQDSWSKILELSQNEIYSVGLKQLLSNERYLKPKDILKKIFELDLVILKRLLIVMKNQPDNFDLVINANKIEGPQGQAILQLLRTEPHFQKYLGAMLNFVTPSERIDAYEYFNFETLLQWYRQYPQQARSLMPIAHKHHIALRMLMTNQLFYGNNPVTPILEIIPAHDLPTVGILLMRLIPVVPWELFQRLLVVGKQDYSFFCKLCDLATISQIKLTDKVLTLFERSSPITHFIRTLDFSLDVSTLKEIFILQDNPQTELSNSISHLMTFVDQEDSELLKQILHGYIIGFRKPLELLFTINWKEPKTDLEEFYLTCARDNNFLLIDKMLKQPSCARYNFLNADFIEFIYSIRLVLSSYKEAEINSVQDFCFTIFKMNMTKAELFHALGLFLFVSDNSPRDLIRIINKEGHTTKKKLEAICKVNFNEYIENAFKDIPEDDSLKMSMQVAKTFSEILVIRAGVLNRWIKDTLLSTSYSFIPTYANNHMSRMMKKMENPIVRTYLEIIPEPQSSKLWWIANARDAQRKSLEALLYPLRQSDVGSCFATSVAIKNQREVKQFLRDCREIISSGGLTRKQKIFSADIMTSHFPYKPLLLGFYETIIMQMGSVRIKEMWQQIFSEKLNKFKFPINSEYQIPLKAYKEALEEGYGKFTSWIYDINSTTDYTVMGNFNLHTFMTSLNRFNKVINEDDLVKLFKNIQNSAKTKVTTSLSASLSSLQWKKLFSPLDKAIVDGSFLEDLHSSSEKIFTKKTFFPEEILWKHSGGYCASVLAVYYELDLSEIILEKVMGDKGQNVAETILDVFSVVPKSIQKSFVVSSKVNHSFCTLARHIVKQELSSKEDRDNHIRNRKQLTYPKLSTIKALPTHYSATDPIRTLITEVALESGGLLTNQVEEVTEKINRIAFEAACEADLAKTAFPWCNTNYIDTDSTSTTTKYGGMDFEVTGKRFRFGSYKYFSDADGPEFTPEKSLDNFTFYFV